MFQRFFTELRAARVPVSLKEYLVLVEALEKDAIPPNVQDFYYLSRAALVKDERHLDKFDRVFGQVFKGIENTGDAVNADIPEHVAASGHRDVTVAEALHFSALMFASDGAIYFSDPTYGRMDYYGLKRDVVLGFRGVYRVAPEGGEPQLLADDFGQRRAIADNGGCAAGKRLQRGQAEALVKRGHDQHDCEIVERR